MSCVRQPLFGLAAGKKEAAKDTTQDDAPVPYPSTAELVSSVRNRISVSSANGYHEVTGYELPREFVPRSEAEDAEERARAEVMADQEWTKEAAMAAGRERWEKMSWRERLDRMRLAKAKAKKPGRPADSPPSPARSLTAVPCSRAPSASSSSLSPGAITHRTASHGISYGAANPPAMPSPGPGSPRPDDQTATPNPCSDTHDAPSPPPPAPTPFDGTFPTPSDGPLEPKPEFPAKKLSQKRTPRKVKRATSQPRKSVKKSLQRFSLGGGSADGHDELSRICQEVESTLRAEVPRSVLKKFETERDVRYMNVMDTCTKAKRRKRVVIIEPGQMVVANPQTGALLRQVALDKLSAIDYQDKEFERSVVMRFDGEADAAFVQKQKLLSHGDDDEFLNTTVRMASGFRELKGLPPRSITPNLFPKYRDLLSTARTDPVHDPPSTHLQNPTSTLASPEECDALAQWDISRKATGYTPARYSGYAQSNPPAALAKKSSAPAAKRRGLHELESVSLSSLTPNNTLRSYPTAATAVAEPSSTAPQRAAAAPFRQPSAETRRKPAGAAAGAHPRRTTPPPQQQRQQQQQRQRDSEGLGLQQLQQQQQRQRGLDSEGLGLQQQQQRQRGLDPAAGLGLGAPGGSGVAVPQQQQQRVSRGGAAGEVPAAPASQGTCDLLWKVNHDPRVRELLVQAAQTCWTAKGGTGPPVDEIIAGLVRRATKDPKVKQLLAETVAAAGDLHPPPQQLQQPWGPPGGRASFETHPVQGGASGELRAAEIRAYLVRKLAAVHNAPPAEVSLAGDELLRYYTALAPGDRLVFERVAFQLRSERLNSPSPDRSPERLRQPSSPRVCVVHHTVVDANTTPAALIAGLVRRATKDRKVKQQLLAETVAAACIPPRNSCSSRGACRGAGRLQGGASGESRAAEIRAYLVRKLAAVHNAPPAEVSLAGDELLRYYAALAPGDRLVFERVAFQLRSERLNSPSPDRSPERLRQPSSPWSCVLVHHTVVDANTTPSIPGATHIPVPGSSPSPLCSPHRSAW
ncbi:hypothetical protein DIPPA_00650 [Diplonema papillatum]|nr:hypothetical protein DIPPA_00650 [Diplonema papillatum]